MTDCECVFLIHEVNVIFRQVISVDVLSNILQDFFAEVNCYHKILVKRNCAFQFAKCVQVFQFKNQNMVPKPPQKLCLKLIQFVINIEDGNFPHKIIRKMYFLEISESSQHTDFI